MVLGWVAYSPCLHPQKEAPKKAMVGVMRTAMEVVVEEEMKEAAEVVAALEAD